MKSKCKTGETDMNNVTLISANNQFGTNICAIICASLLASHLDKVANVQQHFSCLQL